MGCQRDGWLQAGDKWHGGGCLEEASGPALVSQAPAASPLPAPGPHPRYLAYKAVGCRIRGRAPIRPFEPAFPLAVLALQEPGRDESGIRKALSQPLPYGATATAKPWKQHSLV